MNHKNQFGLTLIEITVVLMILIALASVTVPYLSGTSQKALCEATDLSMQNLKKIVMEQYYVDLLGQFPRDKGAGLANLHYLFASDDGIDNDGDTVIGNSAEAWPLYDIKTKFGWHGPYVQNGIAITTEMAGLLDASFLSANGRVHDDILAGQSQILDAWGRPLVLQIPSSTSCDLLTGLTGTPPGHCARLVSAGQGNGLGTDEAVVDTPIEDNATTTAIIEDVRQFDDRILYLNSTMPINDRANPPCSNDD